MDDEGLVELIVEGDLVVRIVPLKADFVAEGGPVLDVWSQGTTVETSRPLDTVAFADERRTEQDAFGFRQIVDIAARALLPGVRRPHHWGAGHRELHGLLHVLRRSLRFPSRVDGDG